MSATLMERAAKFLDSKAAAVLAVVPLAMLAAKPQRASAAVLFGFTSASSGQSDPGPAPVSVSGSALPNGGIRISGIIGPLTGTNYYGGSTGGGYDYLFTGSLSGTLPAGELISIASTLNVTVTGGTVNVSQVSFQTISSGISFADVSPPSIVGGVFTDTLTSAPAPADILLTGDSWKLGIRVTWSGQASGDTLTLTIPANSIDISAVPEPATMAMLAVPAALLLRRRRR